jgi:hypothetical protein
MERNNSKKWINDLKIAIINNELSKIKEYSEREVPYFSSIEEAQEALLLVENAKNILQQEKNKIQIKMNQLKQTNQYKVDYNSSINEWKC